MITTGSGVPTPQEPEITPITQTIKVTWAPTAITGAVERTSELIRDYERHSFHLSDQMLTDLCCLVDATRALLAEDERPTIPDNLRRQFEYAVAAVRDGVTCEPGNPASATGITAGQALEEASAFLDAFETWLASESRKDGETP